MARYLVVAHQTAESPEIIEKVQALAREDDAAEFAILVPATPVQHLLTWVEGEADAVAQDKANAAKLRFETEAQAKVSRATVGDASPILGIEDELREHPGYYDTLVICTLPPGVSRWLGLDLPHQAKRFGLPVIHVIAKPSSVAAR